MKPKYGIKEFVFCNVKGELISVSWDAFYGSFIYDVAVPMGKRTKVLRGVPEQLLTGEEICIDQKTT
ncbi:hypothetical protein ACFL5E_00280 [Candidatus Omnitrophota bacterium]